MRLVFPAVSYKKAGGTENLIYQIVKSAITDFQVHSIILGSSDSYVVKRLDENSISYVLLTKENIAAFKFLETDLWIHTHNSEWLSLVKNIPGQAIVWSVLAPSIINWNRFGFEKKITGKKLIGDFFTKNLISALDKKNALVSMDTDTATAIEVFLGKTTNINILPVPIGVSNKKEPKQFNEINPQCLSLSYIGRSEDIWKIKPVKRIVADLSRIKKRFIFNIYTNAQKPYDDELKGYIPDNIDINFHIGLYGNVLQDHLTANTDIHFSMGMSALEGGVCGLPTMLVDPSYQDIPEGYRYRWLYQTEGNSLGNFISEKETSFIGKTMIEMMQVVDNPASLSKIAQLCSDYVIANHSPYKIVSILLNIKSDAGNKDIALMTPSTWRVADYIRFLRCIGKV